MRYDESVDNFEKWKDQWQKAMDDGVFEDTEKPAFVPSDEPDYHDYVQKPGASKKEIRDIDADYWERMHRLSKGNEHVPDPLEEVINEDTDPLVPTEKPDGKTSGEITDELGGTPNPTNTTNREVDNRRHVTPNWAGGKKIIELHNMKLNLYKLEAKVAADPMLEDDKSQSIMDQIKNLWRRIDILSNELNPDFTREYQD